MPRLLAYFMSISAPIVIVDEFQVSLSLSLAVYILIQNYLTSCTKRTHKTRSLGHVNVDGMRKVRACVFRWTSVIKLSLGSWH